MDFNKIASNVQAFATSASNSAKEMATKTKIRYDLNMVNEKLNKTYCRIGKYVANKNLLSDEPNIAAIYEEIFELKREVDELNEKLTNIK